MFSLDSKKTFKMRFNGTDDDFLLFFLLEAEWARKGQNTCNETLYFFFFVVNQDTTVWYVIRVRS